MGVLVVVGVVMVVEAPPNGRLSTVRITSCSCNPEVILT